MPNDRMDGGRPAQHRPAEGRAAAHELGAERLSMALQEAAVRLRAEGRDVRAEGSRLVCHESSGLQVVVQNRLAPAEPGEWEELLNNLVAALLEAAANEGR